MGDRHAGGVRGRRRRRHRPYRDHEHHDHERLELVDLHRDADVVVDELGNLVVRKVVAE